MINALQIRQLSSLTRQAEDIFTEIHRETLKIDHRTNTIFLRVERLAQKIALTETMAKTDGELVWPYGCSLAVVCKYKRMLSIPR